MSRRKTHRRNARVVGILRLALVLPSYIHVVLHEGAHALAARAVGARVRVVWIGSGRVLRVARVCGVRVELRAPLWPTVGGYVRFVPRKGKWSSQRFAYVLIAGPYATFVWNTMILIWSRECWPLFALCVLRAAFDFYGCREDVRRFLRVLFG